MPNFKLNQQAPIYMVNVTISNHINVTETAIYQIKVRALWPSNPLSQIIYSVAEPGWDNRGQRSPCAEGKS